MGLERPISRRARGGGIGANATEKVQRAGRQSGAPLPRDLGAELGAALGSDVSEVRVHTGAASAQAADALSARAYTVGRDIHFGAGEYQPHSTEGKRLLAHEVAHTVQQGPAPAAAPQAKLQVSSPGDRHEQEADRFADAFVAGTATPAVRRGSVATSAARQVIQREGGDGEGAGSNARTGPGFAFSADGHTVQVQRWWYEEHYTDGEVSPSANRELLQGLADGPMPWVADLPEADRERTIRELPLRVTFGEGEDTATATIHRNIYLYVGLPPGTNFQWTFPVDPTRSQGDGDGDARDEEEDAPQRRVAVCYVRASELLPEGEGRQASPGLVRQVLERLEADTGLRADGGLKNDLISAGLLNELVVQGGPANAFVYPRQAMFFLFGEEPWRSFETRLDGGEASAIGEAGGGVSIDPDLPAEDKEFAERFLQELRGDSEGGTASTMYIGPTLIAVWREIDEHAQREEIMEFLRGGSEPQEGEQDRRPLGPVQRFRNALHAFRMKGERERLGLEAEGESIPRPHRFPVEGRIINHGDLLFTGKEAAFSFQTTSRHDAFAIPWVHVTWVINRASGPNQSGDEVERDHTSHRDYRTEAPERFEYEFEEAGIYQINAYVDHRFYLPSSFTIYVEVKTEGERLSELEQRTYGEGMFADAEVTDWSHEFDDTSWTDSEARSTGVVVEGDLPLECGPDTPVPDHLDGLRAQKDQIQAYLDSGRADPDALSYAADYLAQLEEAEAEILEEREEGAKPLYIQGVYLARESNATSQELQLVAHAFAREDGWEIAIHDTTQAFDNENSRYAETGDTFRAALEATFVELCKSYPTGRLSIRCETLDQSGASTGRFIGFELDTNSTWEILRSTVWDPAVQIAVNIAGTVVVIFAPATAPVVIPALIAYNGVETVSRMADYYERDNLTFERAAVGIGELAIDLIPYVGHASKLVRIGSRAYYVMSGLEIAGDVVLMDQAARDAIEAVRFGAVREAAELHAMIEGLEHQNASDPRLPGLRQQMAEVEERARDAWATEYAQLLWNQAIIRAPSTALRHLDAVRTQRRDAQRAEFDEAVASRGDRALADADVPVVEAALGVSITRIDGGDVRIAFEVGPRGGLENVRLEVGRDARLETVQMHEDTLRSMRRYEGVAGSLRNLLGRLDAWVRGGGHIEPGTRAFEARFELEKLPRMVEEFQGRLQTEGLDDGTRAMIEQEIASLNEQIHQHAQHLDDVAPGLGFVASRQNQDGDVEGTTGRMGDPDGSTRSDQAAGHPSWDDGSIPPGVRDELMELRGQLSTEEGRRLFDGFVAENGPPERAVRALRGKSRARRGLEETLVEEARLHAERTASRPPHGDAVEEALALRGRFDALRERIDSLDIEGAEAWGGRRFESESQRLEEIEQGRLEASSDEVRSIENNLRGLEAEVEDAVSRGADRVNAEIRYGDDSTLDIDNISNGGRTWTEVKSKAPFTTGSRTWEDEIRPKAEKMVRAAAEHGVEDLRFSFPEGVDPSVKQELEGMGFTVEGEVRPWVPAGAAEEGE